MTEGIAITRVFEAPRERLWRELTDTGEGRTEMRFEQRGERPPEAYERTKAGWSKFFDRIAERLTAV